jgi:hypothetical protein
MRENRTYGLTRGQGRLGPSLLYSTEKKNISFILATYIKMKAPPEFILPAPSLPVGPGEYLRHFFLADYRRKIRMIA